MQGTCSPIVPKQEPDYLPAESARVVAGDRTLLHQGVVHPTGREWRVPAAAGCPPTPALGSGDPMPMEVDPTPIRPEAAGHPPPTRWDRITPCPLTHARAQGGRNIPAAAGRPPTPQAGQGHRGIPAAAGRPPTHPMGPERSYVAAAATPFPSPLLRDGRCGDTFKGQAPLDLSVPVPGTVGRPQPQSPPRPARNPRASPLAAPGQAPEAAQGATPCPPPGKRGQSPARAGATAQGAAKRSKGQRMCPFGGCGVFEHKLRWHVYEEHLPSCYRFPRTPSPPTVELAMTQMAGLHFLANALLGQQGTLRGLMDLVNQEWGGRARGVELPPEVVRCVGDMCTTLKWPFQAPFQVQPIVCPAMLMYWPILAFLIEGLTREQEQAFRALLNTGVDTQQSMGPSGQQAGSADRAAPTPGKPGPGNAAPRTCGPVPLPGKPGMGRATPRTRAPVPPPGKPGEGKPETRERRERRYRQRARKARESSRVLAGNPRRGPRSQMGASPARDDGPPRQRTAPIPDRGHGFPGRKAAPADYGRKVGATPRPPAGQGPPGAARQGAPREVVDSHLHLDRLAARVPQRGLDCIEAVTGRPPSHPSPGGRGCNKLLRPGGAPPDSFSGQAPLEGGCRGASP